MTDQLLICPMAKKCTDNDCPHSRPHVDYGVDDTCQCVECTEGPFGPCVPYRDIEREGEEKRGGGNDE